MEIEKPFEEKIRSFTLSQLLDIKNHIDKEKYPDRYLAVLNEIRNRPDEIAQPIQKAKTKSQKPLLAAFLGLFFGLGQLYNGQTKKAGFFYLINQILPTVLFSTHLPIKMYGLIGLLCFWLLTTLMISHDGYASAKRLGAIKIAWYNRWYLYLAIFVINLYLVTPALEFAFPRSVKAYKIPAGSMEPSLEIGDHIMVNNRAYESTEPNRGDLIVFEYPKDPKKDFIMRIIGLPGEKIEIRDKKVLINGNYIQEPWELFFKEEMPKKGDNFGPVSIPPGKYFLLGDNRDRSLDSRFWGFVDRSQIRGKAIYIYWAKDKSRIATVFK